MRLTGTMNLGQREPDNNGNEGIIHTPQGSRTGASSPDSVYCHTKDT